MRDRRQFDKSFGNSPEKDYLANRWITSPTIRLIDEHGENHGIVQTKDALARAASVGLDLITISKDANPPVCKIYDLSKHAYEQKKIKKEQERKNRENAITIKEVQLRPSITDHDLLIKQRHAKEFLDEHHKVRVVMKFRGRELAFAKNGFEVVRKFISGLGECKMEKEPNLAGNTILAILTPVTKVVKS